MKGKSIYLVVFTDLDGTLLDNDTYSFRESLPGVNLLKKEGIPIVLCSSKTRAEQEALRRELDIQDPFVVENGGAVFINENYFQMTHPYSKIDNGYQVLELGQPYVRIREVLTKVRDETNLPLLGYGDLSVEELASITGLSPEAAKLAMKREYEETIVTELAKADVQRLKSALKPYDLTLTRGGRFLSVKGPTDKGRAVIALTKLYRREHDKLATVGIGDSWNDIPLLSSVHIPILVQRPGRKWERIGIAGIKKIDGVGPAGWTIAIKKLLAGEFKSLSHQL
jgi:mannosyl-3-phosphoglycerate phosphatase